MGWRKTPLRCFPYPGCLVPFENNTLLPRVGTMIVTTLGLWLDEQLF